ncbi:Ubiquitin-conjugating enzyme [Penicillium diatomitis]|uniref:Ubiquitin-conjugating enzyme E2 2 n=1 Tax=Penicillium diatomitis TaxID=2819901 RepID=A0A9W9XML6_9EURO|nr:Ubiquitin-conjugating enzyme [Penicillium diatomitis]KAJ5495345.1 Ubiquitin-conjugating enzyme [Penicillium diatomitis]
MAERRLMKELSELSELDWVHVEMWMENIFVWDIFLPVLNKDSIYYGAYIQARMNFPPDYPYSPPVFRIKHPLLHPNIANDGSVCISILHPPGDDEMSGETASERWSAAQSVESILVSILSLLDDAEISSPANVDAAKLYRDDQSAFQEIVRQQVQFSIKNRPAGFEAPTENQAGDDEFWIPSPEGSVDFSEGSPESGQESDVAEDAEEE